jgi:uncharacterized repeat protein (TIGR03987 family)
VKPILIAGTTIVNLALIFYTLGIFTEQKKHRVTRVVMMFLTFGVSFDIVATACMIIGSENSPFTPHGILGYSSLVAMLTDTILAWRHRREHNDEKVPGWFHIYSRCAYIWWVLAYITGAILVFATRA